MLDATGGHRGAAWSGGASRFLLHLIRPPTTFFSTTRHNIKTAVVAGLRPSHTADRRSPIPGETCGRHFGGVGEPAPNLIFWRVVVSFSAFRSDGNGVAAELGKEGILGGPLFSSERKNPPGERSVDL